MNKQLYKFKYTSNSELEDRLIENIQPESERKNVKINKRELEACEKLYPTCV